MTRVWVLVICLSVSGVAVRGYAHFKKAKSSSARISDQDQGQQGTDDDDEDQMKVKFWHSGKQQQWQERPSLFVA